MPFYAFGRLRDETGTLRTLSPDIMVTAAYGQILTQEILDIPPFGVINVHASLLPEYRGSSPIQWAIIDGKRETGVTIMQTERGLDTGDILRVRKTPIGSDETAGQLSDRLAVIGAEEAVKALDDIGGRPSRTGQTGRGKGHLLQKTCEVGRAARFYPAGRRTAQPDTRTQSLAGGIHRMERRGAENFFGNRRRFRRCAGYGAVGRSQRICGRVRG